MSYTTKHNTRASNTCGKFIRYFTKIKKNRRNKMCVGQSKTTRRRKLSAEKERIDIEIKIRRKNNGHKRIVFSFFVHFFFQY